ncbi:MAG: hypothetical protein AB4372_24395 [Xenococcus sp. (in: cyanobacteria)]
MYVKPQPKNQTSVKLNSSITWWANLLPPQIKAIMPHWSISAAIVTILAKVSGNQLGITMVSLFWASMVFTLAFLAVAPYIGRHKWVIPGYHALLFAFVAKPVWAQTTDAGAVCTTTGLFSQVTIFVNTVFNNITFGGATAGGSLSALICQVVGLLTVGLLLGFLGVLGTVSYQVGYQRQPLATVLDPVFGFLIFAGGATFVTTVMLGAG